MGLIQTAAPGIEPVTVAEVVARLRLDTSNVEPAPGAPSVALASPAAPGNVDNGDHRYLVTFGTADGETQGGLQSSAVSIVDKTINGQVRLSGIPLGGSLVTLRRLYRTRAGGTVFYLLAIIADNTTTTYTDNAADATLGQQAPATNTTGDPLLKSLITVARQQCELRTGRALITQGWQLTLDDFPIGNPSIRLPLPALQGVQSVKYLDVNGVQQTLANTEYQVVASELAGRILPAYNKSWPTVRQQPDAVLIDYTCGFGDASAVPQSLKDWMLLAVNHLFSNPDSGELPRDFFGALLDLYIVPRI